MAQKEFIGSNKPMVPTAPASPDGYSPDPVRRHIGQPFGNGKR